MKEKLDAALVKKYPKIFKNRYSSMKETCMCWGFCCGDGWYNIIDALCANIQGHIDHTRNQRARALRYNRALKKALSNGDVRYLYNYYQRDFSKPISDWTMQRTKQDIESGEYRKVPDTISQVVAVQVKEKFGGLRFYTQGGDDVIFGMIRVAESMAIRTCEECGNPGHTRVDGGWHRTLCDTHAEEYASK
jgi:hypothetical protein